MSHRHRSRYRKRGGTCWTTPKSISWPQYSVLKYLMRGLPLCRQRRSRGQCAWLGYGLRIQWSTFTALTKKGYVKWEDIGKKFKHPVITEAGRAAFDVARGEIETYRTSGVTR